MVNPVTTRFAPSPTGLLHLGHAYAARFAASHGQRFLLRVEDIDLGRCKAEWAEALIEDLAWLGLSWQGEVRVQSKHFNEYAAVLAQLQAKGLIYPCFCTRADIARAAGAPQDGDHGPVYPGTCRDLASIAAENRIQAGEPYALRLNIRKALDLLHGQELKWFDHGRGWQQVDAARLIAQQGDIVLGRTARGLDFGSVLPASYHLCSVWDDAMQGITLVTRGDDLFEATHIHRVLQAILGLPVPEYHHHPLLMGQDGARLSKRNHAPTLRSLREQGLKPDQIWLQLAVSNS